MMSRFRRREPEPRPTVYVDHTPKYWCGSHDCLCCKNGRRELDRARLAFARLAYIAAIGWLGLLLAGVVTALSN